MELCRCSSQLEHSGQLSLYIDAVKGGVSEYGQIKLATQEASLTSSRILRQHRMISDL